MVSRKTNTFISRFLKTWQTKKKIENIGVVELFIKKKDHILKKATHIFIDGTFNRTKA